MTTESSQKPNPRNTQHGLTLMKRAIREHGTRAIDRRTSLGKALDHWRKELVSDLGGTDQVSTQQLTIITIAVKTKLLLDSLDTWLLKQPSLINHRKRAVHPVVLQRQQLADSLIRAMVQLGLERKATRVPSLTDYLNGSNKATPPQAGSTKETKSTNDEATSPIPSGKSPGQDAKGVEP
jgi:hypothetical protein